MQSLEVTNSNIIVNDGGNQATADTNDAGVIVEMSDATDAAIGYDSTCATFFLTGEVGSLDCLVSESATQQLTNKELGNTAAIDANLAFDLVTTTKASRPCPSMTEAQRDALTPVDGSCVYNQDTLNFNVYNGTIWTTVGGGISLWETSTTYQVGDVVHESDKIYRSTVVHTSDAADFNIDLIAGRWVELSDDLNREADGTVTDNNIVRWDGSDGDNVQTSGVSIDDLNNITGANSVQAANVVMTLSNITALGSGNLTLGSASSSVRVVADVQDNSQPNSIIFNNAAGNLETSPFLVFDDAAGDLTLSGSASIDNLFIDGSTLSNVVADTPIILEDVLQLPQATQLPTNPPTGFAHLFYDSNNDLKTVDENGADFLVKRRSEEDFLVNPSFEKSFTGSETLGWTLVAGTASLSNSTIGGGQQAIDIALTAQTLDLNQGFVCDSFVGDSVTFSAKVTTSLTDVSLCAYSGTDRLACDAHDGQGFNSLTVSMRPELSQNCIVRLESSSPITGSVIADEFDFSSDQQSTVLVIDETFDTIGQNNLGQTIIPSLTPVPFNTLENPQGAWNGTAFTVPFDGIVEISGAVVTVSQSPNDFLVVLFRNGAALTTIGEGSQSTGLTPFYVRQEFNAGDILDLRIQTTLASRTLNGSDSHRIVIKTQRRSTNVVQESDLVSSDQLTYSFKGTAIDCLVDSPGTFNTFSYSAGSNAATLCTTAPPTPPNSVDGILMDTRPFSSADGCSNNPSRIEICLGPDLRGVNIFGYASTNRSGSVVSPDYIILTPTTESGFYSREYNERTGVLRLDAAESSLTTNTQRDWRAEGGSLTTAYWHFSASRNPLVNGIDAQVGDVCYVKDVKGTSTAGGSAILGVNTRDLNTLEGDCGFLTLSSNQLIISSGSYEVSGSAPAFQSARHNAFLFSTTSSTVAIQGTSEFNRDVEGIQTRSFIDGPLNVSLATETFELRHQVNSLLGSTTTFGVQVSSANSSVYSQLKIRKVR